MAKHYQTKVLRLILNFEGLLRYGTFHQKNASHLVYRFNTGNVDTVPNSGRKIVDFPDLSSKFLLDFDAPERFAPFLEGKRTVLGQKYEIHEYKEPGGPTVLCGLIGE